LANTMIIGGMGLVRVVRVFYEFRMTAESEDNITRHGAGLWSAKPGMVLLYLVKPFLFEPIYVALLCPM
jgi:hypothetical protein